MMITINSFVHIHLNMSLIISSTEIKDMFNKWLVVIIQWAYDWINPTNVISQQLPNEWKMEIEPYIKYTSYYQHPRLLYPKSTA